MEILNPKNTQVSETDFIVVPNGLKTVKEMGLFTINKENFIAEVTSDTSQEVWEKQSCTLIQMLHQEHYPAETCHLLVEIGVLAPVEETKE